MRENIVPALTAFQPEFLFISAGFDAHADDPLAGLNFTEEDYVWATDELMALARSACGGRLVSVLEGGYNPDARSEEHTSELQSLMRISYAVFCLKKKNTKHKILHTTMYTVSNTYD